MNTVAYAVMFFTTIGCIVGAIKTRKDKSPATLLYIVFAILTNLFLKEGMH